jgi:hypothetical protein
MRLIYQCHATDLPTLCVGDLGAGEVESRIGYELPFLVRVLPDPSL